MEIEAIKHDLHWLMFWCFLTGFIAIDRLFWFKKKKKKKRKSKYPKCDCNDVNQCDKWCHAKAMYTKDWHDGKI